MMLLKGERAIVKDSRTCRVDLLIHLRVAR